MTNENSITENRRKNYVLVVKESQYPYSIVKEMLLKVDDTSNSLTSKAEIKGNEVIEIICALSLENGKEMVELIIERTMQDRSSIANYYYRLGRFCNKHHACIFGIDSLNIAARYNPNVFYN